MKKEKLTSIIIASMMVLSTLALLYIPMAESGSFTESTNQYFYGTLDPQVVSAGYEGKSVKFQFSLTSNTTAAHNITQVLVTAPTGWAITEATCNSTWTPSTTSTTATFVNNTAAAMLSNGTVLQFNITATVKVGTGTWTIACSEKETSTSLGSVTKSVLVAPYFKAEISPSVVKSNNTYTFDLKITHNTTLSSIYMVNITYPTTGGWSYVDLTGMPEYWVIDSHDTANGIIVLRGTGGHFISSGQSATFSFQMTLATDASSRTWSVTCTNTAMQNATMTVTVDVDDEPPNISITSPTVNRVSGTVWINATVTDAHLQEWVIKINGTQVATGTTSSASYEWDTTSYADAVYQINVTATDVVGNERTVSRTVTVDNTEPQLIEITLGAFVGTTWYGNYTPIDSTFWIPGTIDGIKINATFSDTTSSIPGNIYFNTTAYTFTNNTWIPTSPYSISGVNSITVKINITDDLGNRYVHTWTVSKDFNAPTTPTYTEYEVIYGGIIIKGLSSSDAESGISHYNIYINGSVEQITPAQLNSATWYSSGNLSGFSGTLVINLTAYGGSTVNVTITSVDNANMESNATTIIETIPDGRWYPIELQAGWNLISLPLVPANSSIENVLSLLLKSGTLESVWSYDAETEMWHSYAPGAPPDLTTMTDGAGYFIKVTVYNVLIIQGTEQPAPPALPRAYHVVPGWNLIGYKRLTQTQASDYLSGVDYIRVYRFDPVTKTYVLVRPTDYMAPGVGYWVAVKTEGWIYP